MFEMKLENDSGNVVDINDGVNYVVTAVSGLNPPSASIFLAKSPTKKGGKYNGSTLNERNIILTVKLLGDVEKNRNELYAWVDSEQYVKVYYRNGIKNVYCEGHVEECAVDIFTNDEVVNIAIVCENPYWISLNKISNEISELLKQFTFSFAIDANGVPFSTIEKKAVTNIYYDGGETGVIITAYFKGAVENLTLYDESDPTRNFIVKKTFTEGEALEINTDRSPKTCTLTHFDGTTENALKYVVGNPTWFMLKKGYNRFGFAADEGANNVEIVIDFTTKYLGV